MSVLDDLKYIHENDKEGELDLAEKQWQQYQFDFKLDFKLSGAVKQLVIAGMGGSGLAAKTLHSWPGSPVPIEIVQDYRLPKYVDKTTLLICISYSGDTEEIISVLGDALKLTSRPQIVTISSGGELSDMATQNKLPQIKLPTGYPPRLSYGYQLAALAQLLEVCQLASGLSDNLKTASDWLAVQMKAWIPITSEKTNLAKRLALDLLGKSVVIYAGPKLAPAAYKWKISINENAKQIAWYNQYSEFNHNEFVGWLEQPVDKPYEIVELRSVLEEPQIQKRFELSNRLLSGRWPSPTSVDVAGDTLLKQLLWSIALGDFVSLYLALLNRIDPTPVSLLERLKVELKQDDKR